MLGLAIRNEPVFMNTVATSCGGNVRVHRTDHGHFIHVLAQRGKNFADFDSRLAAFAELEGRGHGHAVKAGQRLVLVFGEDRFRIPGVHVRRRTLGEDMDDVFGLGGKMSWLDDGRRTIRRQNFFGKQTGQAKHAQTHAATSQKLSPGVENVLRPHAVVTQAIAHKAADFSCFWPYRRR